ncbi:hypothetical protein [Tindallia californiensis]|uniref:Uncharacterized protein n=1 Tax=Tindallia californiensis TaxID=159292 RepID=A0A1H3IGU2_9FIRM|nr:hypothetical protein [Tindallia californiensis]SDY26881.1 hypothetical protein SAMN05192546_101150 [Tindallia californiensis]
MKLGEILFQKDKLKNRIYAIRRAIVLSDLYLKDDEVIQNLNEMKLELEEELNQINKSLETIEDMEM